jgi:hypothetical protein
LDFDVQGRMLLDGNLYKKYLMMIDERETTFQGFCGDFTNTADVCSQLKEDLDHMTMIGGWEQFSQGLL